MALVDLGRRDVIEGLRCPVGKRDKLFFDRTLKGFGVRVTEAGSRIFLLQYHSPVTGKVRKLPLGDYREITPAQARKKAEVARGQVRDGVDPVMQLGERKRAAQAAEAARELQAEADAFTVAVLIDDWHDRGLVDRSPRYRHEARRALRQNLAELLERPARAIDVETVVQLIDQIERRGAVSMARRTIAYGGAMYAWAKQRRKVSVNPFVDIPKPGRETSRDRVLDDAELAEVWTALAALGEPLRPCLQILLLTMQRREEVAGMRWEEVDMTGRKWTIPQTRSKNDQAHDVHLAEPVLALLRGVIPLAESPFVFTTTGKTPISGFSKAKAKIDATIAEARARATPAGRSPAPMPAWVFHDFRRTGVTKLADIFGMSEAVADRLLNHRGRGRSGAAGTYQRAQYWKERREAHDRWARYVMELVQPKEKGK